MNVVIKMLEKVTKQARARRKNGGGGGAGGALPRPPSPSSQSSAGKKREHEEHIEPIAGAGGHRPLKRRVILPPAVNDVPVIDEPENISDHAPAAAGGAEENEYPPRQQQPDIYHKTSLNVNLVNAAMAAGKEQARLVVQQLGTTIDALVKRYNRKIRYLATCEGRWAERAISLIKDDRADNGELATLRHEARLASEWARIIESALASGAITAHKLVADMEIVAIAQVPFFLSDYNLGAGAACDEEDYNEAPVIQAPVPPQDSLDMIALRQLVSYRPERDSAFAGVKIEPIRSRFTREVVAAAARVEAGGCAPEDTTLITAAVTETFRLKAGACAKVIEMLEQTRTRVMHLEGEFARQLVPFRYVHRVIAL